MEDFEQFLRRKGLKDDDRDQKIRLASILFAAIGIILGVVLYLTR